MHTTPKQRCLGNPALSPITVPPLSRQGVSIITDHPANGSYSIGQFKITTWKNVSRIDEQNELRLVRSIGTIPQARLGFLLSFPSAEEQVSVIRKLSNWICQARLVPQNSLLSYQVLHDIQLATGARLYVGESPLTAPSCFRSCWSNSIDKEG